MRGVESQSLGDAAHTMSPFKGQGANQALLDAEDLAAALSALGPRWGGSADQKSSISHKREREVLCEVLRRFEQKMDARVAPKVSKTHEQSFAILRSLTFLGKSKRNHLLR
mgnify:CR=1 FL=1